MFASHATALATAWRFLHFIFFRNMESKIKSTAETPDSGGYSFSMLKPLIEDKVPSGRCFYQQL